MRKTDETEDAGFHDDCDKEYNVDDDCDDDGKAVWWFPLISQELSPGQSGNQQALVANTAM